MIIRIPKTRAIESLYEVGTNFDLYDDFIDIMEEIFDMVLEDFHFHGLNMPDKGIMSYGFPEFEAAYIDYFHNSKNYKYLDYEKALNGVYRTLYKAISNYRYIYNCDTIEELMEVYELGINFTEHTLILNIKIKDMNETWG